MTTALPDGAAYGSTRPYDARGWCEMERRTCAISKCAQYLARVSNRRDPQNARHSPIARVSPAARSCLWDHRGFSPAGLAGLGGMQLFDALRKQLKAGRPPPLTPDGFAESVRARCKAGELAFTAGAADMELVIRMYASGFVKVGLPPPPRRRTAVLSRPGGLAPYARRLRSSALVYVYAPPRPDL